MPNKNTIKVLRLASVAVVALAAALILPMTVGAAPPSPLNPASNIARDLSQLFWIVLAIAGVLFFFVECLLIYTIIRYRRRYEHEMPEQIHGNPTLEIVWTVIPTLIMIALFVLTLDVANRARQTPDDAYVIEVGGRQWFWEFSYPDTEITIFTPADDLFIPADTPVEFQITGGDVIHSFWVPEIAGKYDAIPGTVNVFWVTVDEGTYAGQCAEFCGLEHYNMLFDVRAVPQAEFDEWMAEKVAEAEALAANTAGTDLTTELPPGDAARGELL
ncbi:MAG: cytochrome c oxidase subunit II, partial [Anaerolineae bacterium]